VPLGFNQLYSREPVQEVSTALPLLDSARAKTLKLEEVICDQLEVEGCEHVLTCFRSRGPVISLDLMMLRSTAGTEEAASSGVQEAAKVVPTRFSHLPKDA
jgi:hypothetical protein